jgi:hypothetical protein
MGFIDNVKSRVLNRIDGLDSELETAAETLDYYDNTLGPGFRRTVYFGQLKNRESWLKMKKAALTWILFKIRYF